MKPNGPLACLCFVVLAQLAPMPPLHAGERLAMGTGGVAGMYFPLGAAMAKIVGTSAPGLEISVQSTGASGENLRLIQSRDLDLAFVQNDLAHAAHRGEPPFPFPFTGLRAIASLYPECLHVMAGRESGIATPFDIKGKRVSVGVKGSGNEANCRQIFEFYGLSYENTVPAFLPYGETASKFVQGEIDALVFTIGTSNPVIDAIHSGRAIRFVPIDGAERDAIIAKYPYFTKASLAAGSYPGLDEAVETISVRAMLITHKDVPEETVYAVTKAIFDNLDKLRDTFAKADGFDAEKYGDGVTIPLHPGAERYFREKGVVK